MYRINFNTTCHIPMALCEEQMRANIKAAHPMLEERAPHDTPLAVVGGGPSVSEHLDELRKWEGDIWAINEGASWFARAMPNKNVWLFTVDPDPAMAEPRYTAGVERAILSSACPPGLFKALSGKDVRMFHCRTLEDMPDLFVAGGGRCSASRAVLQASWCGYRTVTFFGCEGSIGETTHTYRNDTKLSQMIVRAGERHYITTPDLYFNTEDLASDFRRFSDPMLPHGLKEKSGGLLRAMIEYPDSWEIVALSKSMRDYLDPYSEDRWTEEQIKNIRKAA